MISFIGNRPALQIGSYQVLDYDTVWLDAALQRAATAANHEDFPLVKEIRNGVELYLENNCPLNLLQLEDLFEKVRKMLAKIGCEQIAEKLKPLAPPITISLVKTAKEAGCGFELGFFETMRSEIAELREAGAEEIHFTGLKASAQILKGQEEWDKNCDTMLDEIKTFLVCFDQDLPLCSEGIRLSLEV